MSDAPDQDPESVEEPPPWDANDPRRQKDCFAPPSEPCECYCLHCQRTFKSDQIWFQQVVGSRDGFDGFWMCPTPNCDGAGFTFDIFPIDPEHPANAGWVEDDDEEYGEECFDEQGEYIEPEDRIYNPDEPDYKQLDEELGGEEDDDIEGEEWKYGLEPGQRPPEQQPQWSEQARRQWEDEQKRYDGPDQRPRVVDWSDRETGRSAGFSEDDIPF